MTQQGTEEVEDGGAVTTQQQEELGYPEGEHNSIEVDNADDPEEEATTETLPAAQPKITEIDGYRFRLRGVRARQLPGRRQKQLSTKSYGGDHPNRSKYWLNEDEVQISMPCELYSQDSALQVDSVRVCSIRSSLRKAEWFASTWLIYAVSVGSPGLLKINCESHSAPG